MYHFLQPILAAPQLYLDPGSGSFLIQLLLAAILGIGVATRLYWAKIKTFFNRKSGADSPVTKEDDDER